RRQRVAARRDPRDVALGEERRLPSGRRGARGGHEHRRVPRLHLDLDEANAAQVQTGDSAVIVATSRGAPAGRKRPLLTEREVALISARGDTLSAGGPYLVTPAARDRAKALGIWRDER
ncbi:MAG: hypothetical protein Q7J79_07460, partial [Gemmatimonadales bacterium]|nr:hypothetical protein [Gemmatimonadales bacterium]